MTRKGWGLTLVASALALGCQTLLDFSPSAGAGSQVPDSAAPDASSGTVDAESPEASADGSAGLDAARADAAREACVHTFCDDFEETASNLTDRWSVFLDGTGNIDAGAGNHASRGLRFRSATVADAATDRRAYVLKTFNLDGGAQTIRAKMALDCATRLVGNQYVLVLGVRIHDPNTNQDTAEAFFARTISSTGANEKARVLVSAPVTPTGDNVDFDPLPDQWVDVALELHLNAGAWKVDGSAGTVTGEWTQYEPNVLVHKSVPFDLTALETRDGGQVVQVRMGIEYLSLGSGDAVDIGIDDVEIDVQ